MSTVGEYVLYEELGSGAFGTVFKVKKNGRGKCYAMKRVPLNRSSDVERELDSQEALPRSSNVVALMDSHFTRKYINLVLDFCNHGNLNDYTLENRVGEERLAAFMRDMIKGVKHLHDHNIVHRDVFSLGVVFYAIQAMGGTLIATVNGSASYKRIKKRVSSQVTDRAISDCIKSMLHKNYRDRIDIDELELNFNMATL